MASTLDTTVKSDTAAAVTATESFYKKELVAAKAELAKLESETFSFKTVAIVGALGVVVGFLLHLL